MEALKTKLPKKKKINHFVTVLFVCPICEMDPHIFSLFVEHRQAWTSECLAGLQFVVVFFFEVFPWDLKKEVGGDFSEPPQRIKRRTRRA